MPGRIHRQDLPTKYVVVVAVVTVFLQNDNKFIRKFYHL